MSLPIFTGQVLADFSATAAVLPSSRFLAEAMVEPLPLASAQTVVEFGPGTGVMTRLLLAALPATARVIAFEINPHFAGYLRDSYPDPRLTVVALGAETAPAELRRLGVTHVDGVLSSLGLALMPEQSHDELFAGLRPMLGPRSVFTQFQYISRVRIEEGRPSWFDARRLLGRHFAEVRRRMIVRNFPPAFVYQCSRPL